MLLLEKVGTNGPKIDIAVDPLEGTNFVAKIFPMHFFNVV